MKYITQLKWKKDTLHNGIVWNNNAISCEMYKYIIIIRMHIKDNGKMLSGDLWVAAVVIDRENHGIIGGTDARRPRPPLKHPESSVWTQTTDEICTFVV